jgi:NAD(P)H dehydrogenase (quinone)
MNPMNVSVILAHPDVLSFNHAIAAKCLERLHRCGHQVIFHDLYQEGFDSVLPAHEISRDSALPTLVQQHCSEIRDASGIIVIHPNWWGQPPAILKGWIDRVIRPGVAYEFAEGDDGDGVPVGLLKAGSAIVFNTSNTEMGREKDVFLDPLETIWRNCVFGLCGVKVFYRKMFSTVVTSDREVREGWLSEVAQSVERYYPGAGCR